MRSPALVEESKGSLPLYFIVQFFLNARRGRSAHGDEGGCLSAPFQVCDRTDPLVKSVQFGEFFLQVFDFCRKELDVGFPNLSLLTQLIDEKGFFSDLDVIAKEERDREDEKGEKIDANLKTFLFDLQASNPEGGMAQNKDIVIFPIHHLSPDI